MYLQLFMFLLLGFLRPGGVFQFLQMDIVKKLVIESDFYCSGVFNDIVDVVYTDIAHEGTFHKITFPAQEPDVQKLIQNCADAPFGRNQVILTFIRL